MTDDQGSMNNVPTPAGTRRTHLLLAIIAGILAVIAVELSDRLPTPISTAVAQIPDSGRQRAEIASESRRTNELLQQILDHLRTKSVKVVVEAPDKARGEAARGH